MIQAFVITLREGIEAALIIGLITTFLKKSGNQRLLAAVWWGLFTAILASLGGAILFQHVPINQEVYEGTVYLTAAFFLITMVFWMARHAIHLKSEIEEKIGGLAQEALPAWQSKVNLFLFTFVMILREGVETVLFLSALLLAEKNGALSLVGGLLGLACAAVFGILLVTGSLRIPLKPFFQTTSLILSLISVQLIVLGFHELFEAGIFPGGEREMALIGPVVRNQSLLWIFFLLIPILLLFFPSKKKETSSETLSSSERRQSLAQEQRNKRTRIAILILSIPIFAGLLYSFALSTPKKGPDPLPIQAKGEWIHIPIQSVVDGNLHTFNYTTDKTTIRFIVIQAGKDRFATALDGCQICGPRGYAQQGSKIICIHCTAEIFPPTIGQAGGCNPIPFPSKMEKGEILIRTADLKQVGENVFKTHR